MGTKNYDGNKLEIIRDADCQKINRAGFAIICDGEGFNMICPACGERLLKCEPTVRALSQVCLNGVVDPARVIMLPDGVTVADMMIKHKLG